MHTERYSGMKAFSNSVRCLVMEEGMVYGDNQWRWHNVISPFHRLYYIQKGRVYVRDENRTYSLMAGGLYLIRRNTWMDYYAEETFEKLYFHLNYYSDVGYDFLDMADGVTGLPVDSRLLDTLKEVFLGESIADQTRVMACLYEVFGIAFELIPEERSLPDSSKGPYGQLIREMVARSHMDFSVEQMAAVCNQSLSDFSRKFKAETGLAPKQFLHNQITEKAKMLLLTTDDSVKSIGLTLGFEDSLYFSRFFKKRTGLSPKSYRRSQIG